MGINPATGIDDGLDMYGKKKQTPGMLDTGNSDNTVPTVDPNNSNGVVQLSKAATSGAAVAAPTPAQPTVAPVTDTTKGNEDVLKTAQTSVLNQPSNTALQGQTQGAVSNWLANPMGDFDPAKNKQQQLEKSNADWANSFDAMKRQYGGVSGSGLLQKNMLGNMLQHNVDQADLESKLDTENYNKYVDSMGKSIGAAQIQNKSDADLYSQYLANLGNVRDMAEGERAQDTVTADTAAGIQNSKDLLALGYNNDVQKMAIANGYDLTKLDKQYGHETALAMAQNDFEGAQASLDREKDMVMQSNDITATASNIQKQLDLDKWKQENGQTFTAEQNAMNRTLETSLKTMDIDGQKAVMQLKAAIDKDQLLTEQDFQGAQAGLDRALEVAKQNKDIEATKALTEQKASLDLQAQTAQNNFTKELTISTQLWQHGENVDKNTLDRALQANEIAAKQAEQDKDIDTQKYLADQKAMIDLKMQTNDMTNDQAKMKLAADLEEAKATNDVARQKQIIQYQTIQEMNMLSTKTTYENASMELKNRLDQAAANNDSTNTMALMKAKAALDSEEANKNRALEEDRIALEGKKITADINGQQQQLTYDQLQTAIANGQIAPDAANDFLDKAMSQYGITIEAPDPMGAQKAADKALQSEMYIYGQTHPDNVVKNPDGTMSLNETGTKAFYDWKNNTVFGQTGTPQETYAKIAAGDIPISDYKGKSGTDEYKALSEVSPVFMPTAKNVNSHNNFINEPPAQGSTFKANDGELYQAITGVAHGSQVDNGGTDFIVVVNVNTGEKKYYIAGKGIR